MCQNQCTPNYYVMRHPGVQNRKQKKNIQKKTVFVMWSQICGKMAYIERKVTLKFFFVNF